MLKAINFDESSPQTPDCGTSAEALTYIQSGGGDAALVWAPLWRKYEPQPGQFDESQWANLDASVKALQKAGIPTYVVMDSSTPAWAYANQVIGRNPPSGRKWRLPPDAQGPAGPWSDFLRKVLSRHPHVQGVVVMNEPNPAFMDASGVGAAAKATAKLMVSAAQVWRELRATPLLMGPATWSGPGAVSFTYQVLGHLALSRGWHEGVKVAWAHHHYSDVKTGSVKEVKRVLRALWAIRWPAGAEVWLTEGGYQFNTVHDSTFDYEANPSFWHYRGLLAQERVQLNNVTKHFNWCLNSGQVAMWANYEYRDSLWGGWASGLVAADGVPHPLHSNWIDLGGGIGGGHS